MTSIDDPGTDSDGTGLTSALPGWVVHTQLVEALVHVLIEKGVLTRNDALSIIQTVAQVTQGQAVEGKEHAAQTEAALQMLQRMYNSFEALEVSSRAPFADTQNVHILRPPIYGGRPEFPAED